MLVFLHLPCVVGVVVVVNISSYLVMSDLDILFLHRFTTVVERCMLLQLVAEQSPLLHTSVILIELLLLVLLLSHFLLLPHHR